MVVMDEEDEIPLSLLISVRGLSAQSQGPAPYFTIIFFQTSLPLHNGTKQLKLESYLPRKWNGKDTNCVQVP